MILLVISYFIVRPFLMAIFLGALLAYVFYPLFKWGRKKIHNKTLVALLICLIILIIILIPSILVVNVVVKESYSLYVIGKQQLSTGISFENCSNYICNTIKDLSNDPQVNYQSQEILKSVTSWIIKKGTEVLVSIPQMLLKLFVVIFILFFLLRDGDIFMKKISDYIGMHKKNYIEMTSRLKEVVHAIVYGYGLVALIQGALGALGFFLFGISNPIFWGIIMAVLSFIPFLGTGLVWVPAAILLFLQGVFNDSSWLMYKGAGLFIYGMTMIGGIDNLIRPKIVGDRANIHPAIIILGIFGGIALLGSIGLIVGPLILSLTAIIVEMYLGSEASS